MDRDKFIDRWKPKNIDLEIMAYFVDDVDSVIQSAVEGERERIRKSIKNFSIMFHQDSERDYIHICDEIIKLIKEGK